MPATLEQVARDKGDRLGAEAAALVARVEEEVDAGMAVVGLLLLGDLDASDDPALDLDHE